MKGMSKRDMFGTYSNNAADARRAAAFRAWLCKLLNCSVDSCYTTGELVRDARAAGLYGWDI